MLRVVRLRVSEEELPSNGTELLLFLLHHQRPLAACRPRSVHMTSISCPIRASHNAGRDR